MMAGNPDHIGGLTNSLVSRGLQDRAGFFWQWFAGVPSAAWGCARILE